MFTAILHHTPSWVWLLLAGLVALGWSQSRDRLLTLQRATLLPLAMVGLSLHGLGSAFGWGAEALTAWLAGAAAALAAVHAAGGWRGIEWRAAARRVFVPGSWIPMVAILGVFGVKFAVGVMLAMQPALRTQVAFIGAVALVYGGFSGLFFSRGIASWQAGRHARRASRA
jgi:hypothetical protein